MSPETLMLLARPISAGTGAGSFLRIVFIVSVIGIVLLGWVLLRAGRDNDGGHGKDGGHEGDRDSSGRSRR